MIRRILALLKPRYVYRSSVTGLFVSKAFAEAHPNETTREQV